MPIDRSLKDRLKEPCRSLEGTRTSVWYLGCRLLLADRRSLDLRVFPNKASEFRGWSRVIKLQHVGLRLAFRSVQGLTRFRGLDLWGRLGFIWIEGLEVWSFGGDLKQKMASLLKASAAKALNQLVHQVGSEMVGGLR